MDSLSLVVVTVWSEGPGSPSPFEGVHHVLSFSTFHLCEAEFSLPKTPQRTRPPAGTDVRMQLSPVTPDDVKEVFRSVGPRCPSHEYFLF